MNTAIYYDLISLIPTIDNYQDFSFKLIALVEKKYDNDIFFLNKEFILTVLLDIKANINLDENENLMLVYNEIIKCLSESMLSQKYSLKFMAHFSYRICVVMIENYYPNLYHFATAFYIIGVQEKVF